jgi:hypothetical protein
MINLDEHKVYVESHKMDMVPYSVVKDAITELQQKVDKAMKLFSTSIDNINDITKELND